jgi:hypothetical protein
MRTGSRLGACLSRRGYHDLKKIGGDAMTGKAKELLHRAVDYIEKHPETFDMMTSDLKEPRFCIAAHVLRIHVLDKGENPEEVERRFPAKYLPRLLGISSGEAHDLTYENKYGTEAWRSNGASHIREYVERFIADIENPTINNPTT